MLKISPKKKREKIQINKKNKEKILLMKGHEFCKNKNYKYYVQYAQIVRIYK